MKDSKEKIICAAVNLISDLGYNGFSFRKIAEILEIKSSSIHYHFPKKEDLGIAVIKHYTKSFFIDIEDTQNLINNQNDPVAIYIEKFENQILNNNICIGAIFATDAKNLPTKVLDELKLSFEYHVNWLEKAYTLKKSSKAKENAIFLFTLLEGAMITQGILNKKNIFNYIKKYRLNNIFID